MFQLTKNWAILLNVHTIIVNIFTVVTLYEASATCIFVCKHTKPTKLYRADFLKIFLKIISESGVGSEAL